jgi:hypothetical protein
MKPHRDQIVEIARRLVTYRRGGFQTKSIDVVQAVADNIVLLRTLRSERRHTRTDLANIRKSWKEDMLRDSASIQASMEERGVALARAEEYRSALAVIAEALEEPSGGSYWPARRFLDQRSIYNDDLSDLRVLRVVAERALAAKGKK